MLRTWPVTLSLRQNATTCWATSPALAVRFSTAPSFDIRIGVGDAAPGRNEAADRGNVHDPSRPLLAHVTRGGPGEDEGAAGIGREDLVPDLHAERVQVGERDADVPRGIVDEDVEPSEAAGGTIDGGFGGPGIGLVDLDGF